MKNKAHIVILFLMLLIISSSNVLACGNSPEKNKTEKKSCSKEDNHSEKKSCCDNGERSNDGCGGVCDNSSCHRPSVLNSFISFSGFELPNSNNYNLLVNEWTYVQNKPKAVYLSIWQPPKIS